tara:strand:+ start:12633 stop:13589 length:957 start_codon:yes stop_codon:yes gene_type:complete
MSVQLLQAFSSRDVTSEHLADTFKRNPYYLDFFNQVILSLSNREEMPVPEAGVVMLGMQNSRNHLIVSQMVKTIRGESPLFEESGKLNLDVKGHLSFALQCEDYLSEKQDEYVSLGFSAGLFYDFLREIVRFKFSDLKDFDTYLDAHFLRALRSAKVARLLSLSLKNFSYKKYAFSAGLLQNVGEIALSLLSPEYFKLSLSFAEHKIPRSMRVALEYKRVKTSPQVVAVPMLFNFPLFRKIAQSIFYTREPYRLKSKHKDDYDLSIVLHVANEVADSFQIPNDPKDPILQKYLGAAVSDHSLNSSTLLKVLQDLGKDG